MLTWAQFIVPVLEVLADGETRRLRDISGLVADHVGLTADERAGAISSAMLRHHDRIGRAASDLAGPRR
jgi:restriction system protein